jgi:hypothetical protein
VTAAQRLPGPVSVANLEISQAEASSALPAPERLCQLLREGYTPGTLGYNGMWRAWPDSVSGNERVPPSRRLKSSTSARPIALALYS